MALAVGITAALDVRWGSAPRLGRFFSPFHGFWRNAEPSDSPVLASEEVELPGAKGTVRVAFDERLVPHVFAENTLDAYRAQGYVTARFRLFQMDMLTRAAAGRLSEAMGERFLEYDRSRRRIGMLKAAREVVERYAQDPELSAVVGAYCEGANAYIRSLRPADYPFEYKLLDFAPEAWTPLRVALLLKYMAWDLTGAHSDVELSRALHKYGRKAVEDLYPDYLPYTDPIVPPGTKWDFTPEKLPAVPENPGVALPAQEPKTRTGVPDRANGSNNWAVHGSKSASGYPILANDPHLALRLPSIWFEIQLKTPDFNVYGASLPGAPGVVIGFNEHIAWGLTNVGADVLDWYRITFKDSTFGEYFHAGTYKPVSVIVDTIWVRGRSAPVRDSVLYTHHGPVVYRPGEKAYSQAFVPGCALKWAAHAPSAEMRTLLALNKARNYDEFRAALQFFDCPAQNFCYAGNDKIVALHSNGKFPLKWKGQGKYVLDGSDPAHDWAGWVPREHLPAVKNPSRGFVSSANQAPADSSYPYYLDWNFATFERGAQINRRLAAMRNATPDSLRMLQNDNYNLLAERVLPRALEYLRSAADPKLGQISDTLERWNRRNDANSVGATIFYLWWEMFEREVWEDQLPSELYQYPPSSRTAKLLLETPNSPWFDDERTTDIRETAADAVRNALLKTADSLRRFHPDPARWRWAEFRRISIYHLLGEKLKS
ncbi:MAG: penicillin acylase family protein, partial [Bacteroidia bacterium]|nr:penicillin acylase family protein [Bacteroidia bacterium]